MVKARPSPSCHPEEPLVNHFPAHHGQGLCRSHKGLHEACWWRLKGKDQSTSLPILWRHGQPALVPQNYSRLLSMKHRLVPCWGFEY